MRTDTSVSRFKQREKLSHYESIRQLLWDQGPEIGPPTWNTHHSAKINNISAIIMEDSMGTILSRPPQQLDLCYSMGFVSRKIL